MSERRRRTVRVSGDSEEFSEGSEDVEIVKASEGESEHDAEPSGPRGESEYESADSDDERISAEKSLNRNNTHEASSDVNEDEEDVIDEEDEELYEDKREEGDGQEENNQKEKKLDDDEDRRNPQYIPKRGTFYEHDDRTAENQEEEVKKEEPRKKKVWKENDDSWSHDKFNESDQAPKSRDELVASYGYDIRSEEGPPRARRRRRYGRGPNKYDRNWEDENAYSKPTRGGGRGGLRKSTDGINKGSKSSSVGEEDINVNDEEFPALSSVPPPRRGATKGRSGRGRATREFESSQRQQARQNVSEPPLPPQEVSNVPPKSPPSLPPAPTNEPTRVGRGKSSRMGGSGRFVESRGKPRRSAPPPERNDRRNFPGPREEPKREPRKEYLHVELEMKKLSVKEAEPIISRDFRRQPSNKSSNSSYHQSGERRQVNVPPRLQQDASANRPKRYSSQRQRSLPESSANNYEPTGFYEQGYQQHAVFAEQVQPSQPQPPVVPVSSAQPPAPSPQILPPPGPAFAPNFPSPPPAAFISHVQAAPPQPPRMYAPTQPAPTFMAPSGSMINYVPSPPAQFTPTYPPFQSFPPVPQPPPPQPEIFVPSSGITYYSPQNQVPRHTPLKRPKAAIPIVPPPPKDVDRSSTTRQESPPNSQAASTSTQEEAISNSSDIGSSTEQTPKKEIFTKPPEQATTSEKLVADDKPAENVIVSETTELAKQIEQPCSIIPEEKIDSSIDITSVAKTEVVSIESTNVKELSTETTTLNNVEDVKSGELADVLPTEVSA